MTGGIATSKQSEYLDWLIGGGMGLVALVLYIATLAPTVLEADGGEFQFVPWLPGIAHPTGYPFYTLLGWLWSHLFPVGEVAWRINLLSAIFAALAVGLTYLVARQLLDILYLTTPRPARILVSVIAAGTFAITPTFWSQAVIAEVYALHALFVAVMLGLALKWRLVGCNPDAWSGKLLALTFGLSLTHHRTTILLLPALLLFWGWHYRKGETKFDFRLLVSYALLLVAPLLLYLYLPLIAPSTPYTTLTLSNTQILTLYDNSVTGFWQHVMGSVFTGELRPGAAGLDRVRMSGQFLLAQVGWVGVLLAVAGVASLWRRRHVDLLILTGLGFVAFVTFNLVYFVGDINLFFIPAWFLVCLWLGVGMMGIADLTARYFVRRKTTNTPSPVFQELRQRLETNGYHWALYFVIIVLGGFLIVNLAMRNSLVIPKYDDAASERWQEILAEPLPKEAVLISNDRNEIMPMWYYQYVESRRPDLLGLFPLIVSDPAYANVGRVLDQAWLSNRPVYFIKPMAGLTLKANIKAEGSLFRVEPIDREPTHRHDATLPEITLQSTDGTALTETIKLVGYDAPSKLIPGEEIAVALYWQPVQPLSVDYTSFVHLVTGDGRGITQSDHRPGGAYYPSSHWQVGETLRDLHTLTIPPEAPPGYYQLRVGLYYQPDPGKIHSMGPGELIGTMAIEE